MKLASPVQVSQNASIICLPPDVTQTFAGTNLTISGWGTTSSGGSQSPALKAAFITGMTNSACSATGYGSSITANMICATTPAIDTDTCQGDSGGKILYYKIIFKDVNLFSQKYCVIVFRASKFMFYWKVLLEQF